MNFDIVIIGAGPIGLALARSLYPLGLDIALVDPATDEQLAAPSSDGREIALTHPSRAMLEQLDIWARIDPAHIAGVRAAWVFDGDSPEPMKIDHHDGHAERLGWMVGNCHIRRAAYESAIECSRLTWLTGRRLANCWEEPGGAARVVELDDGRELRAGLVIAADGRFSPTRRLAGIGTRQRDFGQTMLIARFGLENDHHQVTWEWFGHDRSLALLPLNGNKGSAVITLAHEAVEKLKALDDQALSQRVEELYEHRLGTMRIDGPRFVYPLIGVWPDRLIAPRLALAGDAAAGMHPVTAHGFNLGLSGVRTLTAQVQRALEAGRSPGEGRFLQAYEARHRAHALPLYLATNTIVGLYSNNALPARLLRRAALRGAQWFPPFRRAIARQLTGGTADG